MIAFLILRWAFLLAAALVILALAPIAWRALRRPRPGDFLYLLFFGLAVSRLLLIGKGFAYPNPPGSQVEAAWIAVAYVLGTAAELGVLVARRWERTNGA